MIRLGGLAWHYAIAIEFWAPPLSPAYQPRALPWIAPHTSQTFIEQDGVDRIGGAVERSTPCSAFLLDAANDRGAS